MNNGEIKKYAAEKKVRIWQIADKLGIADYSLSRKLRHELPDEEKVRIINLIDEISAEGGVLICRA